MSRVDFSSMIEKTGIAEALAFAMLGTFAAYPPILIMTKKSK